MTVSAQNVSKLKGEEEPTVSRTFRNKSMSDVLLNLRRATDRYRISFIYNELEDFRVSKSFEGLSIPEAIRECIGFYPITLRQQGDSLLVVESMQKYEQRLIGRLVDEQRKPVAFANITLYGSGSENSRSADGNLSPHSSFLSPQTAHGVSNEDGRFCIPSAAERVRVVVTCVGYDTLRFTSEAADIGTLTLHPSTEHLAEVTVQAASHRSEMEREVYLPTTRQRNAANGGIGLLSNLGIPQLSVNRITGEVKSNTGRAITYCIDERIVELSELNNLRPKDVLRVEYIDAPQGKFADKEVVVNFVLRQYDYGGYVEAKDETKFLDSGELGSLQAVVDHKKMRYALRVASSYNSERDVHSEKEEDLLTALSIHKTTTSQSDHVKIWTQNAAFSTYYRGERLKLSGQVGYVQSRQPEYNTTEQILYSGDVAEETVAFNLESSRQRTAYFYADADWRITDKQLFSAQMYGSLGWNRYDSDYQEGDDYLVSSHTKERTSALRGYLKYVYNPSKQHSLSLTVMEYYQHYIDHYRGTVVADQNARQSETIVWPVYIWRPNAKWYFNFRPLGFSVAYWKTRTDQQSYFSSRGAVAVKYQPNGTHNLQYAIYLGNSNPAASMRSRVEQVVNRYEVLRGNPDLKKTFFMTNYVQYGLSLSKWQMLIHAQHELLANVTQYSYEPEGEILVQSTIARSDLHMLSLKVQQSLSLHNSKLQLQGGLKLGRNILTGAEGGTLNYLYWNLNAQCFLGDFSLSAYYKPAQTQFMTQYYREHSDYGISATYGKRGFFAEIGARRMFQHDQSIHSWFRNWQHYSLDKHDYGSSNGPWLYARLSYTFDFGRKTERQEMSGASTGNSAILHR